MTRDVIPGILVAMLLALALRCPELDRRPMHNDEAVNAVKCHQAMEAGAYRYDPNEHHGPTLYYATRVWLALTGGGDFTRLTEGRLRALTVCFGVGLILLFPLAADGMGRWPVVWAGVLTAVSPAMVYYSRDYIHETLFVFFSFAAMGCGWRYWRSRKLGWGLLAGAAVGLLQATKETFVLPVGAMILAVALNAAWSRWMEPESGAAPRHLRLDHLLAAVAVWLGVAVLFFSSFLGNAAGPLDAVRTYSPWIHRAAGGSPHDHPWDYYLTRLAWFHTDSGPIWSEGLILVLAAVGAWAALSRKGPPGSNPAFLRFLLMYAVLLAGMYSAIAYKTPWCLLGFWQAFILLAGVGAVVIFHRLRRLSDRVLCGGLLAVAVGDLAWQAWQLAVPYSADRRNPYVYAQTSPNILELRDVLNSLASVASAGRHLVIEVMAPGSDYWPLPWTLRAFDQVGWWSEVPSQPPAPVIILSPRFESQLDSSGTHVMAGLFELRPDVFFELYVETNLWERHVRQLHPNAERR